MQCFPYITLCLYSDDDLRIEVEILVYQNYKMLLVFLYIIKLYAHIKLFNDQFLFAKNYLICLIRTNFGPIRQFYSSLFWRTKFWQTISEVFKKLLAVAEKKLGEIYFAGQRNPFKNGLFTILVDFRQPNLLKFVYAKICTNKLFFESNFCLFCRSLFSQFEKIDFPRRI